MLFWNVLELDDTNLKTLQTKCDVTAADLTKRKGRADTEIH